MVIKFHMTIFSENKTLWFIDDLHVCKLQYYEKIVKYDVLAFE